MKQPSILQIVFTSAIISLVVGVICKFDDRIMSSLFILFFVNLMMSAIFFGPVDGDDDEDQ